MELTELGTDDLEDKLAEVDNQCAELVRIVLKRLADRPFEYSGQTVTLSAGTNAGDSELTAALDALRLRTEIVVRRTMLRFHIEPDEGDEQEDDEEQEPPRSGPRRA